MLLNDRFSHSLLVDAYKFYMRGDARAHDALKIIIDRNEMDAAVIENIQKAVRNEPGEQELFIKASCFGKQCYPGVAIDEYHAACRELRFRNICRDENIDPTLDRETIIELLLADKKYSLAFWLVKWLKCDGQERIIHAWAEHLIKNSYRRDDNHTATLIQDVLTKYPIVSFADVANKAIELNRNTLAIKLLENEVQSAKQIPLLLNLKQYDLVLAQALATFDPNLIYMAIFRLQELLPNETQFLSILKKHKQAFQYYKNYLAANDVKKLIFIAYNDDPHEELRLHLSTNQHEAAMKACRRLKLDFVAHQLDARDQLHKFHSSIKQSQPPPTAPKKSWDQLSVSDTIINLIASGQTAKAKDCQKKFEVSDKKYRHLEQIAMNILPKLVITPLK